MIDMGLKIQKKVLIIGSKATITGSTSTLILDPGNNL